jgi:hypothetical protein
MGQFSPLPGEKPPRGRRPILGLVSQKASSKKAEGTPSAFRYFAQINFSQPSAAGRSGRNFNYIMVLAICQEKSCTNIKKIKIPILCILPIAICEQM